MNDRRKELMKMLLDCKPSMIVIENKDRLTRFGFNYIDCLLDRLNCKIVTINEMAEDEKDLMTDMVSILTSFCCRLYGLRRGHNKVNKMKSIMEDETDKIETK